MRYAIICLASCTLSAADQTADQPSDIRDNAKSMFARTGEDLTRLPTAIGVAYDSIVNDTLDSNMDRYLVTGSIALKGLQARAEMPLYVRNNPGAGRTTSGIGDAEVDGSLSVPLNGTLRIAAGLEASLDTAEENALGLGANLWTPYLGVAVQTDAADMVVARFSYASDDGDLDIERWELLVRGVRVWDERIFTGVDVIPGYDSGDDSFLLTTRVIAGAYIDDHNMASVESRQPLDSDSRELNGWDLRVNYYFQF